MVVNAGFHPAARSENRPCVMGISGIADLEVDASEFQQRFAVRIKVAVMVPSVDGTTPGSILTEIARVRTAIEADVAGLRLDANSTQNRGNKARGIVEPQCAAEHTSMSPIDVIGREASTGGEWQTALSCGWNDL